MTTHEHTNQLRVKQTNHFGALLFNRPFIELDESKSCKESLARVFLAETLSSSRTC